METVIPVHLPQHPYQISICPGGLRQIGLLMAERAALTPGQRVLVVANPNVFRYYGDAVAAALTQAGFSVFDCLLPAGERYKTLKSVQKIYDAALAHRLERGSAIVALGGGVIGDMAGFAAATWLRGIPVVQVPTSLLAMVDAAIGGKTGVNHPQGKNLIGAFHQPRLVLIDPETLQTLPKREFRAAIAEVIKYGVIWDVELFEQLEAAPRLDQLRSLSPELLLEILVRSCRAKAEVVGKDEREAGLRAILNYGHTIGHAIEALTHYRVFNHGEAVGLGMLAVGELAVELGYWSRECADRQANLIQKAHLPNRIPPQLNPDQVIESLQADKKVQSGHVRFVFPTGIGAVKLVDQVPSDAIARALRKLQVS
ncbi:MAG: 3-dehydroquinate synthase [Aphanocapsa sp. GSE-SYN-MK-11-07L]|jgi:3-dehydroquinate synthase|nr:3-dehydroquinate synthase [Aphanocapsa sp. GSE-SYN-MK-11-07L]